MAVRSIKRWRNLTVTLIVAVAVIWLLHSAAMSLRQASILSGWLLISLCLILALYNVRKKLPFLPLIRAYTWLQAHLYIGMFTSFIFLFHAFYKSGTGLSTPKGWLEVLLATLFIIVAGSGFIGIFLSRVIPPRLAIRGQEILFERIPIFRRQIREQAHQLALQSIAVSDATTLADYYANRLSRFFDRPRHFWHHIVQSERPLHSIENELADLDRYLSGDEKTIAVELRELVRTKDDLDYHHALQLSLKGWLFIHIGFTYGMILLAAVHAIQVYAFRGSVS